MAIYGLTIVLILIFAPRGLVGVAERLWSKSHWGQGQGTGGQGTGRALSAAPPGARGVPPMPRPHHPISHHLIPHSSHSLITHHSSLIRANPPHRHLTMVFGGLVAVDAISLSIPAGEVRGIIGPNGSGKTTFLNLVSGIYRPAAGEIHLEGSKVTNLGSDRLVQKGIARTFQNIRLFPRLSVLENVKVARYCRTRAGLVPILLSTPGTSREERRWRKRHSQSWSSWVSPIAPTTCPATFPTDSSAWWRSPAPWLPSHDSFCWTSRPPA